MIEIHVNLILPIVLALMGIGKLVYQVGLNGGEIKRLKKIVTSLHHAKHEQEREIALMKRDIDG